jgi:hypothetical protein
MHPQTAAAPFETDVEERPDRLRIVEPGPLPAPGQPLLRGRLQVEMVGAGNVPRPAPAHVRQPVRIRMVGEVTHFPY